MLSFLLNFISVLLAIKITGIAYDSKSWLPLLFFTLLLILVNSVIKPIIKFFTWPINFLTLGLFHFILNILFIMLIFYLTPGFIAVSFLQAVIFGFVLSITNWILFKFKI